MFDITSDFPEELDQREGLIFILNVYKLIEDTLTGLIVCIVEICGSRVLLDYLRDSVEFSGFDALIESLQTIFGVGHGQL
jgi:hypothetical protein